MFNQNFSKRSYYKVESGPGNFAETIVIVAVSIPKHVNDGNDNSFLQHFSLNIIVSEAFSGRKGIAQEDLFTKMMNLFQKHNSQTLAVTSVLHLFCSI